MTFVPAKNFKQVVTAESLNASKIQITGIPGKYIERFFVQLCQVLYWFSVEKEKKKIAFLSCGSLLSLVCS